MLWNSPGIPFIDQFSLLSCPTTKFDNIKYNTAFSQHPFKHSWLGRLQSNENIAFFYQLVVRMCIHLTASRIQFPADPYLFYLYLSLLANITQLFCELMNRGLCLTVFLIQV